MRIYLFINASQTSLITLKLKHELILVVDGQARCDLMSVLFSSEGNFIMSDTKVLLDSTLNGLENVSGQTCM